MLNGIIQPPQNHLHYVFAICLRIQNLIGRAEEITDRRGATRGGGGQRQAAASVECPNRAPVAVGGARPKE
jgi:hypothetical protein